MANKCVSCDWLQTGSKKFPWKCGVCDDVFPCRNRSCQHVDCHLERARSCHVCGERIPNSGNTFYFIDGSGVTSYPVHKGCVDNYAYSVTTYE